MLFSDIRGFTSMSEKQRAAGDRPHAQRVLRGDGRRPVQVRRARSTSTSATRSWRCSARRSPCTTRRVKAVQCALEMQQALREFNRTRAAEGQDEIQIGIGINTGMVITGAIGCSRTLQYTAIGDAVNTASRLCSVAQAGEIILSEATYRKVQGEVAAAPLPPVRVKGKTDALRVYNAVGMRRPEGRGEETRPG